MSRLALALAGFAGCAHVDVAPTATNMACRRAIRAFATIDPAQLQALPEGCALADAEAVLHRPRGASPRGEPADESAGWDPDRELLRIYKFVAQHHRVEVWTLHRRVVAIDLRGIDPMVYTHDLGAPERIEGGSYVEPTSDDVWFARGIARREDRIRWFPPTTRADYRAYERTFEEDDEDEDD